MVKLRSGRTYMDMSVVFDQIHRFYILIEELLAHYSITCISTLCKIKLQKPTIYYAYLLINYKIYNFITQWYPSEDETHKHIYGSNIDTYISTFIINIKNIISFPLHITIKPKICIICYDTIENNKKKSVCRQFINNKVIEHNYHTHCIEEYIKYASKSVYYGKHKYIVCPYCKQMNYSLPL